MYTSYFTSTVTLEVKVEQSSDLRVEQSLEMGVERGSDLKSGAGRSSNLGVGWNLEQQKCEMGCPLTALLLALAAASSKSFSNSSILHKNLSKISSLSDLVVRWQCIECDHEQSILSFHL